MRLEKKEDVLWGDIRRKTASVIIVACALGGSTGMAQTQERDSVVLIPMEQVYKRVYQTVKVDSIKPVLDGRLDEDFWQLHGEWSAFFVQAQPYERAPSPYQTRMKVLYDDRYIYVGVICYDPTPRLISRIVGNRDENTGDLVGVGFDPYHDFRASSEFVLNAGGTKADMIITDQMDMNDSWNAVWDGRTHVSEEDSCWTAEFRIPFTQLRYRQHKEDGIWGLHVRRVIYRNDEEQNWSLIPQNRSGFVYSFGELHGMYNLPRPRGIEISPYVMGEYQREPEIAGSPYQTGNRWMGNAGLDARFAVRDYTLDVTINPDYGQVEQDPSVMNLTTQETFYDEKRPFFLEGSHIFDISVKRDNMFYSRRLGSMPSFQPDVDDEASFAQTEKNVPIISALKFTGTNSHGLTIGVLQSVTARSSVKVTRNGVEDKEVVEPLTNYTVGRVQRNWRGNTLLGGMVTSVNRKLDEPHLKELLVKDAITAGLDFTQYFNERLYYVDAKMMFSSLQGSEEAITRKQRNSVHFYQRQSAQDYLGVDPTRTSLNGTGGYVEVGRKGNSKWNIAEQFSWFSPGFDLNDIGYLGRADRFGNETEISFRHNRPWLVFRSNEIEFEQQNIWDFGGQLIESTFELQWDATLKNRYGWWISQGLTFNQYDTRLLRGGPDMRLEPSHQSMIDLYTDRARPFSASINYFLDRSLNNDRLTQSLDPRFEYRIGNHVVLTGEFNFAWDRNDLQYVGTLPPVQPGDDPAYIMGRIHQKTYGITLRAQVNITPDISIQFYGAPFTSVGEYDQFKAAADTQSDVYEARFRMLTPDEEYRLRDPDFSFNEFRSNLVARWEYLPGSTLYLVWEYSVSNHDDRYISGWGNNLDRMFSTPAVNTIMAKLNYRFSL